MKYLSLFFWTLCSTFSAAETLTVGTFPVPLMVESGDKGVFIELTKAVAQEAGIDIVIEVYPAQRTLKMFERNQLDILFPALAVTMPIDHERSDAVYIKRDYSFTVKSKPALPSLADLSGKRVGLTAGYPYAASLLADDSIYFERVNYDSQNVKRLLAGRIDAFVVEEKSGRAAFIQEGALSRVSYDPVIPLSEQDVFYAFHKTTAGKQQAEKFSAALKRLKANGTFAAIMAQAKDPIDQRRE